MEMRERSNENGVTPNNNSKPVEPTQKIIGSFGKYQLWLCCLIFLTKFPVAFHQMAILFLSPKVDYVCADAEANNSTNTCPCEHPVYDTSVFTNTITMQWNLICDDKWLNSLTQTLFQFGVLLGSVFFGMASDRFGRKNPLLVAVTVQVITGIAAAYMPDFWSFTIIRFIIGATVGGTMVVGFVLVMEFIGSEYREIVSALYQTPFNLGHMILPMIAYFERDYVNFQLCISIPTVILLCYYFLAPETPRWLIAKNRTEQAIEILEKTAKINKRPTGIARSEVESYQKNLLKHKEGEKGNILDLFKTPNIRKNTLAMAFNWLTCSYCFYGISQYVGQLSGNVFVNVLASASCSLLGTFASIPLMKFIGRRVILITFNSVNAVCLIILAVIPEGVGSVVCAIIGVVASFVNFVVVYLYCSEMFPTVVRNAALGFSSMMARVGSMIAPFVIGLSSQARWLPPVVFAIFPMVAAVVTILLPETKGCELMTTIEEGEEFGKKTKTLETKK